MKNLIFIISLFLCLQSCNQKTKTESDQTLFNSSLKKDSVSNKKLVVKRNQDVTVNRDSLILFGQGTDSDCYDYMKYEQNRFFTDTTRLSNGAMLYYKWNCDSTWLTFSNKKEQIILKSCPDSDPIMCSRLGLNYIKEYPNYLLFIHEWISGCCTPPDLVYIDKKTGKEKERITNDLFVWGDPDKDYALYFSDSTYTSLIYLNHKSDQKFTYKFEEGNVLNSAKKHSVLKINDLFENFRHVNEYFLFDFKKSTGNSEEVKFKTK